MTMPFPFRLVCDLLQRVQDIDDKPTSGTIIRTWFDQHRHLVDAADATALLSTLLPASRPDRVYFVQTRRLESIIARALGLVQQAAPQRRVHSSRLDELRRYRIPGSSADLAECVESILSATPNPDYSPGAGVTVEQIDRTLHAIASNCRFSSPKVKETPIPIDMSSALGDIYSTLTPCEAKWFTRLILKKYQPSVLEPGMVLRSFHPLMPKILLVRDDIPEALEFYNELSSLDACSTPRVDSLHTLTPKLGVKVGRQTWLKGRGISHCLKMGRGKMSVEHKMDGEYCQIHINLCESQPIQIFSKSGKDSTKDRQGLHDAIIASLHIGEAACPITHSCILEGELLVYSDKDRRILDFHHIRKHVTRSESCFHVSKHSQPEEYEHLMIVYFDVLMRDGTSLLALSHGERFKQLKSLVSITEGHSHVAEREVVDFAGPHAAVQLRNIFANCIVSRGEGLVLKPDDPYFDMDKPHSRPYSSCCIKMKKEYIGSFGEVGDLAVVGASFEAASSKILRIPVKFTHFFLACLENKGQCVDLSDARFVVVCVVELNKACHQALAHSTPVTYPYTSDTAHNIRLKSGISLGRKPTHVFSTPMVFDVRCFSFDKASSTGFWSPRFPQVSKVHFDRSWQDVLDFDELQEIARQATGQRLATDIEEDQQMRDWITALEAADPCTPVPSYGLDHGSQITKTTEITISTPRSILDSSPTREQVFNGPGSSMTSANGSTEIKRLEADSPGMPPKSKKRKTRPLPFSSPGAKIMPLGGADGNGNKPASRTRRLPGVNSFYIPKPTNQEHTLAAPVPSASFGGLPRSALPVRAGAKTGRGEQTAAPKPAAEEGCTFCKHECRISNRVIILAPSLSSNSLILEHLRQHHAGKIIREPDVPKCAKTLSRLLKITTMASSDPTQAPPTQRSGGRGASKAASSKKGKLCLVDGKQVEEAKRLLSAIEKLDLRLSKYPAKRDWIPCYDWGVLEMAVEQDDDNGRGKEPWGPGCVRDPWRKNFVGLA